MRLKISIGLLLLFFMACKQEKNNDPKINHLIDFKELTSILEKPNTKIIDFRKSKFYAEGHIQGALNIWRSDIENTDFPYGGMMATKKTVEKLFSSLGIQQNDLLVVYDDNGLCDAARFWWVLQNYGYKKVRLLNGGYSDWKQKKGAISREAPSVVTTSFRFKNPSSHQLYVSKEVVLKSLNSHTIILDTRTSDEYTGKRQKSGASKGGRIPKSILVDWTTAINYHGDKKIKPIDELERIYSAIIPSKKDTIIVYCHTGVRSAHTTFVLSQLLGYENVKNYDGSWSEWSYFNDLPFKKDSITSIKK